MEECKYTKLPLTYNQQIKLLQDRGLIIADTERAVRHLSNISYYRLSAYMLPFKKVLDSDYLDEFKMGVTWEKVYDLYVFDRKLRLLVFDAIERLEVAVRTQIIYQLSHKYGSHWQDNPDIFKVETRRNKYGEKFTINVYEDIQKHIKEQLVNNKAEVFIKHYTNKYSSPDNPPSWMSVEIMYFNHLSHICKNLKNRRDISGISQWFDMPPDIFCSWLHTLNYVRNICAHHARLWNRTFNIVPEKLHFANNKTWINNPDKAQRSKVYYFLCMINFLLQTANPTSNFKSRLLDLLAEYKDVINIEYMGFPTDWQNENIWK